MDVTQQFSAFGLVPVIVIDDAADAVPLARALASGGLPVAEVTCRTPAAMQAIRNISDAEPGMLLGAGTVLSEDRLPRPWTRGPGSSWRRGSIPRWLAIVWSAAYR